MRQNMHARQEPWLISLMPQAKISAMSRSRNDVNKEIEASPILKAIVSIKYNLAFCGILFGSSTFLPKYPFRALKYTSFYPRDVSATCAQMYDLYTNAIDTTPFVSRHSGFNLDQVMFSQKVQKLRITNSVAKLYLAT